MENRIATSIEQSKKLIELGIDVNTADMCWDTLFTKKPEAQVNNHHYIDEYDDEHRVPAWSLTALLEMLPEGFLLMDNQGETEPILYSIWVPGYDKPHIWKNNLVDAAFGMICWLKENKKI